MENWEDWKIGKLEDWKIGRLEDLEVVLLEGSLVKKKVTYEYAGDHSCKICD